MFDGQNRQAGTIAGARVLQNELPLVVRPRFGQLLALSTVLSHILHADDTLDLHAHRRVPIGMVHEIEAKGRHAVSSRVPWKI